MHKVACGCPPLVGHTLGMLDFEEFEHWFTNACRCIEEWRQQQEDASRQLQKEVQVAKRIGIDAGKKSSRVNYFVGSNTSHNAMRVYQRMQADKADKARKQQKVRQHACSCSGALLMGKSWCQSPIPARLTEHV